MEGVIEVNNVKVGADDNEKETKRTFSKTFRDKRNIIKRLSDGTYYRTQIKYCTASKVISFKNEHFDELKDILRCIKDVIKSYGLNHVFISDVRSIVKVLDSRVFPNNWAVCITRRELKDIIFRINALRDYIHNICFPIVGCKVLHFCSESCIG